MLQNWVESGKEMGRNGVKLIREGWETVFQITFRVWGPRKNFRGSLDMGLSKVSYSTTQCVRSGSQLSLVFDSRKLGHKLILTLCQVSSFEVP